VLRIALACGLLALGWQQSAFSWGDEGHRITGHIASALLTEPARQQLRELLGTDDLAQVATWMDDEREALNKRLPGSSRWHYENRAACDQTGNALRVCPQGQCLTRQIERFTTVLRNSQVSRTQRAEAIRMLVHLLGDLHQPLHLIDNHDRGGNDVLVLVPGEREPRRLHEVWDTRLVRMNMRRTDAAKYASSLLSHFQAQRVAWQSGNTEQWAGESYRIGKEYAYAALPGFVCQTSTINNSIVTHLSNSYIQNARAAIDEQLAKAGVRIAFVLNRELVNH